MHVYHNATLTKEERIYASVLIGSKIKMVSLYDIIMLYCDEKAILKPKSTIF